jgi:hypothetical protein
MMGVHVCSEVCLGACSLVFSWSTCSLVVTFSEVWFVVVDMIVVLKV